MDFIKWCHKILEILEKEKFDDDLYVHKISTMIFPEEVIQNPDFHNSSELSALEQTLLFLAEAELAEEDGYGNWKITSFGRKVLADPISYWTEICSEKLGSAEETLVKLVNRCSPQINENPEYGYLKPVNADKICLTFEIPLPAEHEQRDDLEKYI